MKKGDVQFFILMLVVAVVAAGLIIYIAWDKLSSGSESLDEYKLSATSDYDADGTMDLFDQCACKPAGGTPHKELRGCPGSFVQEGLADEQIRCKKEIKAKEETK